MKDWKDSNKETKNMIKKINSLRWGLNNRQHGEIHKAACKELAEYMSKMSSYGYYPNKHQSEYILTRRRALNCTDGLLTDDEIEYRKKLIEKYKKMSKEMD